MSDGCFHGQRTDLSGERLVEWCHARSWDVAARATVPDETSAIVPVLLEWADRLRVDVIFTTGGTGLSDRDVTPEATAAVIERTAPGVSERLRTAGQEQTPYAPLSRGRAGVRGRCLIVNLPGGPGGVSDGLNALAPFVEHGSRVLAGDTAHDQRPAQ